MLSFCSHSIVLNIFLPLFACRQNVRKRKRERAYVSMVCNLSMCSFAVYWIVLNSMSSCWRSVDETQKKVQLCFTQKKYSFVSILAIICEHWIHFGCWQIIRSNKKLRWKLKIFVDIVIVLFAWCQQIFSIFRTRVFFFCSFSLIFVNLVWIFFVVKDTSVSNILPMGQRFFYFMNFANFHSILTHANFIRVLFFSPPCFRFYSN